MRRLRITPTLAFSFCALLVLAVGLVQYSQWRQGLALVSELGGGLSLAYLDLAEQRLRAELQPVASQVEYLGDHLEQHADTLQDQVALRALLRGAVAASERFGGILLIFPDGRGLQIERDPRSGEFSLAPRDLRGKPRIAAALAEARQADSGAWAGLYHKPEIDTTFFHYRRPLRTASGFHGLLAAAVSVKTLSELAAAHGRRYDISAFLLWGTEQVLAHPAYLRGASIRSVKRPLLTRTEFSDPVVRALGRAQASDIIRLESPEDAFAKLQIGYARYYLVRRDLNDFGPQPLSIVLYRRAEELDAPLRLIDQSLLLGMLVMLGGVVAVVLLSRAIARPIRRATEVATQVGRLELADIRALPTSQIREVDDLGSAFNTMLDGLHHFERYVPKELVHRLLISRHGRQIQSEERVLSMMFTDITGFSALSAGRPPAEIGDLINRHLGALTACVERTGGTVDKYIGDSLMAFWGAPETLKDDADRVCEAAQCMAREIRAENIRRRRRGETPLQVRIGMHRGPVIVGNVGAPARLNYSILGEAVNITQRLEALGRQEASDEEVCVLLSEALCHAVTGDALAVEALGPRHLRGIKNPVSVLRLLV